MTKYLVSINDLSVKTIEKIFSLADNFNSKLENKEPIDICKDKIMATMFYESSTRTRMSFESAMFRLGGKVISSADMGSTSAVAKGESLIDTIKVVQNYADVIVLRHFNDGSTMLAAENSDVPIISGGDGAHEHPTQTLCDLYTILKEKGTIKGLNIALCGDLKYGRTVHSLAYGLAKYEANIFSVAPEGFELPEYVEHRLKSEYGREVKKFKKLDEKIDSLDVFYPTPHPTQTSKAGRKKKITIETESLFPMVPIENFDAVYITRIQMERIHDGKEGVISYLVNKELLKKAKNDSIVMHPLPRRDELSYDVDDDKRAAYFRQAAYGIPIRMAIIALFLGLVDFEIEKKDIEIFTISKKCPNSNCITTTHENVQNKYIKVNGLPNVYRCFYCDQETIQNIESKIDQTQQTWEK